MLRAEYACIIPVTLHLNGILLRNSSLRRVEYLCYFTVLVCNKMSDVRLSNASPTLERVDARQPDNVRPPVCRNLFGTPDREEIRRYVTTSLQEDVQAFTERYNFDPVDERPLTPRNYEWQEDGDAPEFYRRPPHGNQRPERDVDLSDESSRQDAAERHERQSDRQPDKGGSRKRRSEVLGSCSSECQSKRSPSDGDDDDDENKSDGSGSQALQVEEERASSAEDGVEVQ
ncbi:cyclin-dependent kinase inhibitor 1B-like [Channa argus]|uniref:cyclin-dependent kinase inhibitor 1B-like n=1 Tax=Channa argus TaxID=215402 RepID=UPI003522F277